MATPPNPTSALVGQKLTAAFWNTEVASAISFLVNPPRVIAWQSVAQSLTNNTLTPMSLDSESIDTDTMHSTVTNNSRVTIVTPGRYRVIGSVGFVSNATGLRAVVLTKNGGSFAYTRDQATNGANHVQQCVAEVLCVAGDYIEVQGTQGSGGALNTIATVDATFLSVVWCSSN